MENNLTLPVDRNFPTKKVCLHTIIMGDYCPEMCKLTVPNLQAYAKKIGADFNIISKPKFNGYPPNFERFQVFWDGQDYMYNFCVDADYILHPDTPDITGYFDRKCFGSLYWIDVRYNFKWNWYFERDGRNQGIADGLTLSTWLSHDVWTPPKESFDELKENCLRSERQVSEYMLSLNLARFGIKFSGIFEDHSYVYTVMATSSSLDGTAKESPEKRIRKKLEEWGCL